MIPARHCHSCCHFNGSPRPRSAGDTKGYAAVCWLIMSGNAAADGRQMSCVLCLSRPVLPDRSDPGCKWLVFVVSCHFTALNFNTAHLLRTVRRLPSLRTAECKHFGLTQIKMITLAFQYWFQQSASHGRCWVKAVISLFSRMERVCLNISVV